MELYLVKDLVKLVKLGGRHSPSLDVNLKFPYLLKPVAPSKSNRDFVGKLRDKVIRDYERPDAEFYMFVSRADNLLYGQVEFNIDRDDDEESEFRRFYLMFEEHKKKFEMWMILELCHLANKNTPVSPEALFTLEKKMEKQKWYYTDSYGFESDDSELGKLQKIWDHEDGFIYSKLTIVVTLSDNAMKRVLKKEPEVDFTEIGAMNRKMVEEEICTDLEIRCEDGGIVKAHRAVLSGRSKVFHAMFQAEEMEEARTGKLDMVDMSEQGVKAFLGWVYWKDDKEAVSESIVAVELLIAGDMYLLKGLVEEMKKIILWRRGCDEEWFCVESAVKLFKWASLKKMKDLKKKALSVLRFFGKTCPDKLVESEEYQEMIEDNAEAAKELTQ